MPYKLLLADDSVTIQRVIELTFADEDVKVTAVGDGQAAIDRIEADPPDIVLADVGMPARDGYEVAAFVKESPALSHIPVLLLTGAFEPVDEVRAQAVRCDGVLAKPFEPQLLIARVKELLAGANKGGDAPVAARDNAEAFDEPAGSGPQDDEDTGPVPVATPAQEFTAADFSLDSVPAPTPMPAASPDLSLDDYFDRLDAAFASLTGAPAGQLKDGLATEDTSWAPSSAGAWSPADPAGLASAPAVPEPAAASPNLEPANPEPVSIPSVTVADAFAALLDAEQQGKLTVPVAGDARISGATPAMVGAVAAPVASPLPAAPIVTDALVDEVVDRLIERLGGDSLQAAVLEIVSEAAERLVREEIERLKARA